MRKASGDTKTWRPQHGYVQGRSPEEDVVALVMEGDHPPASEGGVLAEQRRE